MGSKRGEIEYTCFCFAITGIKYGLRIMRGIKGKAEIEHKLKLQRVWLLMTVSLVFLRCCWMWLSYHLTSQPVSASNYILNISLSYFFFTFCLLKCLISLWILGITCIKTNRPLSVFSRAFSVHEILSSYQHVLIIRMLHF